MSQGGHADDGQNGPVLARWFPGSARAALDAFSRWFEWMTPARASQRSVRCPLQVGAARLGALDVYRRQPGSLSGEALTLALMFAEVAVQQILDGQARAVDGRAADGLEEALGYRHVVYQAQGMVMAHVGGSLVDAMARLRAHAYSTDRPLTDVAGDVVAGRLRLEPDRA
jgi:hypothetical protein